MVLSSGMDAWRCFEDVEFFSSKDICLVGSGKPMKLPVLNAFLTRFLHERNPDGMVITKNWASEDDWCRQHVCCIQNLGGFSCFQEIIHDVFIPSRHIFLPPTGRTGKPFAFTL
jgi:hypothetical protein